jgi:hypothetical protein
MQATPLCEPRITLVRYQKTGGHKARGSLRRRAFVNPVGNDVDLVGGEWRRGRHWRSRNRAAGNNFLVEVALRRFPRINAQMGQVLYASHRHEVSESTPRTEVQSRLRHSTSVTLLSRTTTSEDILHSRKTRTRGGINDAERLRVGRP